jgi:hypothetical protein
MWLGLVLILALLTPLWIKTFDHIDVRRVARRPK